MSQLADVAGGFRRAILEILGSFVAGTLIAAFTSAGLIQGPFVLLFGLISTLPFLALLREVQLWNVFYCIGWFLGVAFMLQTGLLQGLDILGFIGLPIGVIAFRLWLHFR